jgi:uncharacterized circularly permuted ATP-grasp superfamily protein
MSQIGILGLKVYSERPQGSAKANLVIEVDYQILEPTEEPEEEIKKAGATIQKLKQQVIENGTIKMQGPTLSQYMTDEEWENMKNGVDFLSQLVRKRLQDLYDEAL